MRRITLMDQYFNESVIMPGFPQLIVTRGWLWKWLKSCGWNPRERGIGTMDYIVGVARKVDKELTPDDERDELMGQVRAGFLRSEYHERKVV